MRFLEYLFFKYYNWAIKVGDGDIPAFTSVMCISFSIMLYYIDIVMTYYFFISPESSFSRLYKYIFPLVGLLSCVLLYFLLVVKGRDKQIMEKHNEEWTGKKHLVAVLFPIIAYIWFAVALFIKASINSGML